MTFTAGQVPTAEQLNLLASPPRFKGVIATATTIAAFGNINYPVTEDSRNAWNVSGGYYVVPVAGVYLVVVAVKANDAGPGSGNALIVTVNGNDQLISSVFPNVPFGGVCLTGLLRCDVGDQIAIGVGVGFTTVADTADNNYLNLLRVSD